MSFENLTIVPYNDLDDAAITCTETPLVGFEVENTQNTQRGYYWRSATSGGQSITWVFPENRTLDHFSMWRHLNHAGSIRIQAYTNTGASTPASPFSDSGTVSCIPYTASETYVSSRGTNNPFFAK